MLPSLKTIHVHLFSLHFVKYVVNSINVLTAYIYTTWSYQCQYKKPPSLQQKQHSVLGYSYLQFAVYRYLLNPYCSRRKTKLSCQQNEQINMARKWQWWWKHHLQQESNVQHITVTTQATSWLIQLISFIIMLVMIRGQHCTHKTDIQNKCKQRTAHNDGHSHNTSYH